MSELHIVDLSACIHTGAFNKRAVIEGPVRKSKGSFTAADIASGGIALVFRIIKDIGFDKEIVFAADRAPTIKRDMFDGYKSNREYAAEIELQKTIAEAILTDCGFNIIARDTYEADDIIYTIVHNYANEYDKIVVHSDDSDMYFMVCDNVEVAGIRRNGKYITKENYEYSISSKQVTRYNTVLMNKVLHGDRSDCIPALSPMLKVQAAKAFSSEFYYPRMGNIDFMRRLISSALPELIFQFNLVAPLDVVDFELPDVKSASLSRCEQWAYIVGSNEYHRPSSIAEDISCMQAAFFDI